LLGSDVKLLLNSGNSGQHLAGEVSIATSSL